MEQQAMDSRWRAKAEEVELARLLRRSTVVRKLHEEVLRLRAERDAAKPDAK